VFVRPEIALTAQHGPERVFGDRFGDDIGGAEQHDAAFVAGFCQAGFYRAGGVADDLKVLGCGYVFFGDEGRSPGGDHDGRAGDHFEQLIAGVIAIQLVPDHGAQGLQYGDSLLGENVFGEANRGQVEDFALLRHSDTLAFHATE